MSLVQTDNTLLNKMLIVLAYLCDEVCLMRAHAQLHLVPALLLLSETSNTIPRQPEAVAAGALPLLLAVQQFVSRANSATINLVHQLVSMAQRCPLANTLPATNMHRAFEALGEMFGALIILDDCFVRVEELPGSMAAYRRLVDSTMVATSLPAPLPT